MAAMLIGSYVLDLFGISLPIVRVGRRPAGHCQRLADAE
jgi:hypothetical protein